MTPVTVIGAGLAGCECAWQLAGRGIPVRLIEMKPKKMTPAHVSENFAELVCSNSLRSDELTNAVGLLKEELRRLDSVVLASADHNRVAAGLFKRQINARAILRVFADVREQIVDHAPHQRAVHIAEELLVRHHAHERQVRRAQLVAVLALDLR